MPFFDSTSCLIFLVASIPTVVALGAVHLLPKCVLEKVIQKFEEMMPTIPSREQTPIRQKARRA